MSKTLSEDHQELEFEFDFPIEPADFIGDFFEIMRNNEDYGTLDIPRKTGDQIGVAFIIILLSLSFIFAVIFSSEVLLEMNLFFLILSAILLISFSVIAFNPFLRFIPVQIIGDDGNQILLFKSRFGIHKLSSLVRRNYCFFKDYSHHTAYSLYFSHNKGFLKINESKFVLDMKKYNGLTLKLTNKAFNFTIKLNKNNISKNRGNFVISTVSKVDEQVVLFIGFVLYTSGHLNFLLDEIAFQSIRIEPERKMLIFGLISAVLNSLVFPSLTVCLALVVLPSLLHSNSQWRTFFLVFDLILFSILWFYLIKNLLVTPIKHLKKNIWSERDNQKYFVSIIFAVMIFSILLTLVFIT